MAVKNLVIVESPAKAKTISRFLGKDYKVLASFGHIRDLPKSTMGLDTENGLKPKYVIYDEKRKIVNELRRLIDKNTVIWLASDEDREGEAIAWHLVEALNLEKHTTKRIVFHEITKSAILHALETPREVDINMVNAQQARRILDRIIGYKLSPLLWQKIQYGLSAGRVQSVALKIIVDREDEIDIFKPEEFWKLKLDVLSSPEFKAELSKIDSKVKKLKSKTEADEVIANCKGSDYKLVDITEKENTRRPAPPFTTSTLQQEASRKLYLSVKDTMSVAQKLYEGSISIPGHTGGVITYMRTDSVNLSSLACTAAKKVINKEYGSEYSLEYPRNFNAKAKGAQEAHEAIRPVNLELKPNDVVNFMSPKQHKLYSLIWMRTIASQMANAKVSNTTYKIENLNSSAKYEFTAKGTKVLFPGFMKAYTEGTDNDAASDNERFLPNVTKGTIFNKTNLKGEQNFTKPPGRYSEASLVKKLETEGIGRPSTYASTISTIFNRGYIERRQDKKLEPTVIGRVVTGYLVTNFGNIINTNFTVKIEDDLDLVAEGKKDWMGMIRSFYDNLIKEVDLRSDGDRVQFSDAKSLGIDPVTKLEVFLKKGKFGTYVQLGEKDKEKKNKPKVASVPKGNGDAVTLEVALKLLILPRVLGSLDKEDITVAIGRFGPYVKHNKVFYNLKDKDPYELTLADAKVIVKEGIEEKKRNLLLDFSEDGIQVIKGKYGPYIKKGKQNYKIGKDKTEEEIKKLSLKDIKEIIATQPKKETKGKKWKQK